MSQFLSCFPRKWERALRLRDGIEIFWEQGQFISFPERWKMRRQGDEWLMIPNSSHPISPENNEAYEKVTLYRAHYYYLPFPKWGVIPVIAISLQWRQPGENGESIFSSEILKIFPAKKKKRWPCLYLFFSRKERRNFLFSSSFSRVPLHPNWM